MRKGDFVWLALFSAVSAFLFIPYTHDLYIRFNEAHPYITGFADFIILASMGELLSVRIVEKKWRLPRGFYLKCLGWGFFGIYIVFMFGVFLSGVDSAIETGMLWAGSGWLRIFMSALYTSIIFNATAGVFISAAHRVFAAYVDNAFSDDKKSPRAVFDSIDWHDFIRFVLGKAILYFMVPAQTLAFLLPGDYRIISAAYLSIAMGTLLAYARLRRPRAGENPVAEAVRQ